MAEMDIRGIYRLIEATCAWSIAKYMVRAKSEQALWFKKKCDQNTQIMLFIKRVDQ